MKALYELVLYLAEQRLAAGNDAKLRELKAKLDAEIREVAAIGSTVPPRPHD